jgi:hypothetical protein
MAVFDFSRHRIENCVMWLLSVEVVKSPLCHVPQ